MLATAKSKENVEQKEEKTAAAIAQPEDFVALAGSDIFSLLEKDGFVKPTYLPSDLDIANCCAQLYIGSQQDNSFFRVYETICLAPEYLGAEQISQGHESIQEIFKRIMIFGEDLAGGGMLYFPRSTDPRRPVEVYVPIRDEFGHMLLLAMLLSPFFCQALIIDYFKSPEAEDNDRALDFEALKGRIKFAWERCYQEKLEELAWQGPHYPLYFSARNQFDESQPFSQQSCIFRVLRGIFRRVLVPPPLPHFSILIHPIGCVLGDDEQAMARLRGAVASQIVLNKLGPAAYQLAIDEFGIVRKRHLADPSAYNAYYAELAEAASQAEAERQAEVTPELPYTHSDNEVIQKRVRFSPEADLKHAASLLMSAVAFHRSGANIPNGVDPDEPRKRKKSKPCSPTSA